MLYKRFYKPSTSVTGQLNLPRPIKHHTPLLQQHPPFIKPHTLLPQQINLHPNIRPRRRHRPLLLHHRLRPLRPTLRCRSFHRTILPPNKRRLFNHFAIVAVDEPRARHAAVAGDLWRKNVFAQGIAHGARGGVERAGDAVVGGYAAEGNLEEECVDAFLKGGEFAAVEVFEDAYCGDVNGCWDEW